MQKPWIAEQSVGDVLAARLIEEQFPGLSPIRIDSFGAGWDNTAFLVNERFVFRFPRRALAVPWLESETSLLPAMAPHLPLPIPEPSFVGQPSDTYEWPFAGYPMLPGKTACRAFLGEAERMEAAASLGAFLAALHRFPRAEAERLGALPDQIGRVDIGKRLPMIRERCEQLVAIGIIQSAAPWQWIIDDAPSLPAPRFRALCHGDLYFRHLLVDDDARLCGVIDWGDIHIGDPAVDLAIAWSFLPSAAHQAFRSAYGPIDEATWQLARFRALYLNMTLLAYGHDIQDADLLREGQTALRFMAETNG